MEKIKYECPKCLGQFDEDAGEKLDFDEITNGQTLFYCPACFVKWVAKNVPALIDLDP